MANTTDTYWSVGGVSLQTFAKNITTLGGRDTPPPMRGDDLVIPSIPGERYVPKVVGSRILSLGMWVRGVDDDGNVPAAGRAQTYDDNWRSLRNLLWQRGKQFALTKRFKVGGVLKTAVAMAEFNDGLEPTMMGRTGARFTVDLKLADPYFYDVDFTTTALVNGDQTVTLVSDADTRNLFITINGSRNNIFVRNVADDIQVNYSGSLNLNDKAELDIYNFSSKTSPVAGAAYDSTALITHWGASEWLKLHPGANTVNLSSTGGLGTVSLQHKGAWL